MKIILILKLRIAYFLTIFFYLQTFEMSATGKVLFSASEGYDADVWDDTALIQEYERALESSR